MNRAGRWTVQNIFLLQTHEDSRPLYERVDSGLDRQFVVDVDAESDGIIHSWKETVNSFLNWITDKQSSHVFQLVAQLQLVDSRLVGVPDVQVEQKHCTVTELWSDLNCGTVTAGVFTLATHFSDKEREIFIQVLVQNLGLAGIFVNQVGRQSQNF